MRAAWFAFALAGALGVSSLTGCVAVPTSFASRTGAFTPNANSSLVSSPAFGAAPGADATGPIGGGGQPVSTSALYATNLGPIALVGVQLDTLGLDKPSFFWNAPPSGRTNALAIVSASQGWAVGAGVSRCDGGTWTTEGTDIDSQFSSALPASSQVTLTDVAFGGAGNSLGMAVGTHGTVLRYNSSLQRWSSDQTLPASAAGKNFGTVKILSGTEAWVAGEVVLHWQAGTWTQTTLPSGVGAVEGLAVIGPNDIWASTGDSLIHWNGTGWSIAFVPTGGHSIGSPQIVNGNTLVGLAVEPGVTSGLMYTYDPAKGWSVSSVSAPPGVGLDTLVMADANTAYAKSYDNTGLWKYDVVNRLWSAYSK
jgi:hypothetical protein